MPKTEFLQIRLTPAQRERIRSAAEADHLDMSTWARRALLIASERRDSPPVDAPPDNSRDRRGDDGGEKR